MIEGATDQSYTLVFDIVDAGYRQWWFGANGLCFVAAGILLVKFQSRLSPRWPPWLRRGFVWSFLGFSLLWTAAAIGGTYFEYARLVEAARSGQFNVVEGPVEAFLPMPDNGHGDESFTVQGMRFAYSDYSVMAGFNNTSSHGGPIRAGRVVRIRHVGNSIVRLEVAE